MSTSEAIRQFLQQPVNLATAYDVCDWLKDVERHIFETFWSGIRERLNKKLTQLHCHETWEVFVSPSFFEGDNSFIAIAPRDTKRAELCNEQRHYSVTTQQFGGESGSCYFGIYRGARRHEGLDSSLRAEGFRPNSAWSGYRYFKSLNLPDFCLSRDNILRLNTDNQSSDRLVAHAVANQMLALFEKHHVLLQELNA